MVDTVFTFQRSREGHSSLADLVFGLRQRCHHVPDYDTVLTLLLRDTGLTKYPVNNRQRTITYSATIVLRQHKPQFIAALTKHLKTLYPLTADSEVQAILPRLLPLLLVSRSTTVVQSTSTSLSSSMVRSTSPTLSPSGQSSSMSTTPATR